MKFFVMIFVLVLALPLSGRAQEDVLNTDLAQTTVDITTGFNGAQIVLFGTTVATDANIAAVLKGPEQTIIVRRKDQFAGAWMNKASVEFRRVPSYYDYAVTNGGISPQNMDVLRASQVGIDNLEFYPEDEDDPEKIRLFRDALIRRMQMKGFFPISAQDFIFVDPGFFKVIFDLPPGVPTGAYQVETVVYKDGDILARQTRSLQVGQVGFNAQVYLQAKNNALLYGIVAVIIAVISGWGAFTFLRRD